MRWSEWRTATVRSACACVIAIPCVSSLAQSQPEMVTAPDVEVRSLNGRPTVFIAGKPDALPAYSGRSWHREGFVVEAPRFAPHHMGVYLISPGTMRGPNEWGVTPFWLGDRIESAPISDVPDVKPQFIADDQVEFILKHDPDARFMLRLGLNEPASWRKAHSDDLFVTETGERLDIPSLASDAYWDACVRFVRAVVTYHESRPWSSRMLGYLNFQRNEGTYDAAIRGWLYDHSPVMLAAYRARLKEKYKTVEALRTAHNDNTLTFETIAVPRDPLRRAEPEVKQKLYWLNARDNQAMRDYLELLRDLYHKRFRELNDAVHQTAKRKVLSLHDALKQPMQGWNLAGFFEENVGHDLAWPDVLAGSGHIGVATLLDDPGTNGLLTPHDYQSRGMGGVYQPEGAVDSVVLRGKYFFSEMDQRTYTGKHKFNDYGMARDIDEFNAITWRNFATSLTRGFNSYWMDLHTDWFAAPEMHRTIAKQVRVIRDSVNVPHHDLPGIAMVIDDEAVLETSGNGAFLSEAIMTEWKTGLARAGVPFRIYLLPDLALPNFPKHKAYYFPNLFRVDDARMKLLRERVLRDGNVVVWGPGSGISDGVTTSAKHAERLTGFKFEMINANSPRRMIVSNFSHPITRGLAADTLIGSPLAYGPVLLPTDGEELAQAWTKQNRMYAGLAVKATPDAGPGGCTSLFTSAVPLPSPLWHNVARLAGVPCYTEPGDVFLASREYVAIHSLKPGVKRIQLGRTCRVIDVIDDKPIAEKASEIVFTMDRPGTRLFRTIDLQASSPR